MPQRSFENGCLNQEEKVTSKANKLPTAYYDKKRIEVTPIKVNENVSQ